MKPRIKSKIWNVKKQKRSKKQSEQQEEKTIHKNENSESSLWDNFKCSNIHIIGVSEEKRKSKKMESYLKK